MIKKNSLVFYFLTFIVLISIRLWAFKPIPEAFYNFLELGNILLLVVLYIQKSKSLRKLDLPFWNNIQLFIWVPIVLSTFGAFVYHDQGIHYSLWRQRTHFLWLLYPLLHYYKVPTERIIKLLIIVGLGWASLNIVQQFTYPVYFFASRSEDNGKEQLLRAGVYRFMPFIFHYGLFLAFYYFNIVLIKKKLVAVIFVVIAMAGFYYYGTRQFAFGVIVCIIFYSLIQKGSSRIIAITIVFLLASIVFIYQDVILGSYIEMTNRQLGGDDDYIRLLSGKFFLYEYWPSWFTVVTGNGLPFIASQYGKEVARIKDVYGFYASDVGIIGSLSNFGVFYVINVFWTLIKMLLVKLESRYDNYLKLFAVNALLLILLTEYFTSPNVIPFWCIVMYLLDNASLSKRANNKRALSDQISV